MTHRTSYTSANVVVGSCESDIIIAFLALFCSGITACCGAVVGLVLITPSAGFVSPGAAFCEGIIGSLIVFHIKTFVMPLTQIDDGLDCFSIHGCAGMVGFILTACFACPEVTMRGY